MSHVATDRPAHLPVPDRSGSDRQQAASGWWIIPMAMIGTAIWARLIMWIL